MLPKINAHSLVGVSAIVTLVLLVTVCHHTEAKEFKKEQFQKGQHLCIARFESTTGEPLYYSCPKPNESEKKSYCCYLDKCCDYKEFQKQTEQTYKAAQGGNFAYMSQKAIGGVLKFLMWIVVFVILLIVGCCCLVFFLCRKKKLFGDGIFNSPLPAQPPGPNIYTRPNQPYEWPETLQQNAQQPTMYPQQPMPPPSYPMYPSQSVGQPPYNPTYPK